MLPYWAEPISMWSQGHITPVPTGKEAMCQKTWDTSKAAAAADASLNSASDDIITCNTSGHLPNNLGSCFACFFPGDDSSICIGIGLRLSILLCRSHLCHHCGAQFTRLPEMSKE